MRASGSENRSPKRATLAASARRCFSPDLLPAERVRRGGVAPSSLRPYRNGIGSGWLEEEEEGLRVVSSSYDAALLDTAMIEVRAC